MILKHRRVWSQSAARKMLLGEETMNPSIAARSLLGPRVVARAERAVRRHFGRKRRQPGNPLPALAGLLGGLKFGGPDAKKMAIRAAAVDKIALKANTGDVAALESLQRISQGIEWPGGWPQLQQHATQHLELVTSKLEKLHAAKLEQLSQQREAASASAARQERREARFTEGAVGVAGGLGQAAIALSRRGSLRRPVRKRRRRYSY